MSPQSDPESKNKEPERRPASARARNLDEQLAEFRDSQFMAMPSAGAVCWSLAAGAGFFRPDRWHVLSLFIAVGMIFYVGLLIAKITGEDLLGRNKSSPFFDRVFFASVAMSILVFAIAIPFVLESPTSLPLSLGVLTGLMWLPISPLIGHWVGAAHAIARTALVLTVWLLLPDDRFTAVPLAVVAVYVVTLTILWKRWIEHSRREA
ncbi:MAG: hypothetical protein AAGI53_01515 [Planctomycetota bacterium]